MAKRGWRSYLVFALFICRSLLAACLSTIPAAKASMVLGAGSGESSLHRTLASAGKTRCCLDYADNSARPQFLHVERPLPLLRAGARVQHRRLCQQFLHAGWPGRVWPWGSFPHHRPGTARWSVRGRTTICSFGRCRSTVWNASGRGYCV